MYYVSRSEVLLLWGDDERATAGCSGPTLCLEGNFYLDPQLPFLVARNYHLNEE